MRHRHRATARDLLPEAGNDAAGASENVAETHDDELRRPVLKTLADHLRHALRRAHHVGRIDRLVGRHENELFDVRGHCRAGKHPRPPGIVAHRLPGISLLHQRHVLVSRGVE